MASEARYSRGLNQNFNLCMFEDEFIRIGKLVSKIPYAETGGNLFGLWTNYGNAVVLVATGPGQNCKRTSVSFYQDIPYMTRVGNMLTSEYPLCHIGEWHSHHQMHLYEPSVGDCSTVQRNYPRGSQGFVLMIANILSNGTVKLSPYKFVDERSPYQHGKIEVFTGKTPFRQVSRIQQCIEEGMEVHAAEPTRLFDIDKRIRSMTNSCGGDNGVVRSGQTETRKQENRSRSRSIVGNHKTTSDVQTSIQRQCIEKDMEVHTAEATRLLNIDKRIGSVTNSCGGDNEIERSGQTDSRKREEPFRSRSRLENPKTTSDNNTSRKRKIGKSPDRHQPHSPHEPKPERHFNRAKRSSQTAIANHSQETNNRNQIDIQAEISPERNTSVNMDIDVIEETPWYMTNQQAAKEMRDFFVRISGHDSNQVKMSRDPNTKIMSMEFEFHGRFMAVEFPSEFPYGTMKVLQKQYRTQSLSDIPFSYTTCISALGNLKNIRIYLKRKLKSTCRCPKCM